MPIQQRVGVSIASYNTEFDAVIETPIKIDDWWSPEMDLCFQTQANLGKAIYAWYNNPDDADIIATTTAYHQEYNKIVNK